MRALLLPLVAIAASVIAPPARAIPVDYAVTYGGDVVGPTGIGSFSFDSATSRFSGFNWSFADALSADPDTLMANNWRLPVFGGTLGNFLLEILTGEDVHPSACSATSRCTFSSGDINSGALTSVEFRSLMPGMAEYVFRNGSNVVYGGTLSINRVLLAVSEPLPIVLFGAGLLGFVLTRRKPLRPIVAH